MSVENKIKELLESRKQLVNESQETIEEAGVVAAAEKAAAATTKDNSKSASVAVAGDTTQPTQGSSEKASFETRDEDDENPGAKVSASQSNQSGTIAMKGDAKTAKTAAMEEVDIKAQLGSIFGEDLSEEFRTKATSIFEAAVIARVNAEMDRVVSKLEEQNTAQIEEHKQQMVDKIDSYLNYVVENWMEENQVAIDNGLRTEISEEFISGLKKLFKESYIDVPEEKYDVVAELSDKVDALTSKLDETIQENVEVNKKFIELKKKVVFEEQVKDLAATEVEKLKKLVEGVEFDSEDLFKEKVSVIKENYFPQNSKSTPQTTQQVIVEDVESSEPVVEHSDVMTKYLSAIARSVKAR